MPLVVLLRGVNVGGHRTFRPKVLAEKLRHLDAVNLGAAGTFVIRRPVSRARLREELARNLPFVTEILICDGRDFVEMVSADPFANERLRPGMVRFVTVLSRRPSAAPATPLFLPSERGWLVKIVAREGRFAFGVYRRHLKVIRYLGTLDRTFGVPGTTRNWNTVTAIAEAVAG